MRTKCLLLICLVACASAAVLDECARGQSHWCTNLKTAKKCGAIQHCIDNVWSQQAPYKNDDGDICTFCKNMITDVRNLFNNQSEANVIKYIDAACGIIPLPDVAEQCKEFVASDVPEVFQLIRSNLNPGAICSAIELCTTFKDYTELNSIHRVTLLKANQDVGVRVVEATTTTKAAPSTLCTDCEKIIADMKTFTKDEVSEIQKFLKEQICVRLGPEADECNAVVDQYLPELVDLIVEPVDPKMVCGMLGLCQNANRAMLARMRLAKSPLFKAASQLQGTTECDACKVFLSELQDLDRNKVLQAELEDLLKEKLCPILGSLKQECIETVDAYGQFLFEFLANELDPATRCESLGFCSNANAVKRKTSPTRQATLALPIKSNKNLKQGVPCVLCEFVVDKLESLLEDNNTEAEIISALDKVCKILPDTIKEECDTFITTYGPAILQLLLEEVSPQVLCTTLGLCSTTMHHTQPALRIHANKILKSTETCGVCEMVINYVDSFLEEKSTEDEIEKALDKVCADLPGNVGAQCEAFVKQYGPQIIQLIVQLDDPKKVCTELGLCKKPNESNEILQVKAPLVGVNKCTYGPAYWCTSRDTAKECSAVAHCEKHVWH